MVAELRGFFVFVGVKRACTAKHRKLERVRGLKAFAGQSAIQESKGRTFNEIEEENDGRAE
jgi:hypothetical protein